MKKMKKQLSKIKAVVSKEKKVTEQVIEKLLELGFKKISHRVWGYNLNSMDKTLFHIEVSIVAGDGIKIKSKLKNYGMSKVMKPKSVAEFDVVLDKVLDELRGYYDGSNV